MSKEAKPARGTCSRVQRSVSMAQLRVDPVERRVMSMGRKLLSNATDEDRFELWKSIYCWKPLLYSGQL